VISDMRAQTNNSDDGLTTAAGRIRVDAAIHDRFPAYRLRVVFALGVTNGPSDAASTSLLYAAAKQSLDQLGNPGIESDARIAGWREAYRQFGVKASSYPCSVEALLRRASKGGPTSLPRVNRLVDLYNAISLRHVLPIGGEDLDRLNGELSLRFATGQEHSDVADRPDGSASAPRPGEVIWADDLGVTCRRWNWRQGRRTRLAEATTNAYFIVEALTPATPEADLDAAVFELCAQVSRFGAEPQIRVIAFG
jgi:DNA/RNA-binding domain of Phe-tRNA-synthetase-like protein